MRIIFTILFALLIILTYSFSYKSTRTVAETAGKNVMSVLHIKPVHNVTEVQDVKKSRETVAEPAQTGDIDPSAFVEYARRFTGTPYVYGSTDPSVGFDCSGFINHVAKQFSLKVPRSSVDFTNIGETVDIEDAQPGDFILFTGTDKTRRVVGHIGIVTTNDSKLTFIHSTSGKAKGVTESDFSEHYQERFMKVIRLIS